MPSVCFVCVLTCELHRLACRARQQYIYLHVYTHTHTHTDTHTDTHTHIYTKLKKYGPSWKRSFKEPLFIAQCSQLVFTATLHSCSSQLLFTAALHRLAWPSEVMSGPRWKCAQLMFTVSYAQPPLHSRSSQLLFTGWPGRPRRCLAPGGIAPRGAGSNRRT